MSAPFPGLEPSRRPCAQIRMPELPEVETTRRGIAPFIERQTIVALEVRDRRLRWPVPADLEARLIGHRIERVERRAKYLLLRMATGTVLIHLGMTGSLRVLAGRESPRRPHDHFDLRFGNGVTLRYHDPRRFGALLWLPPPAENHALLRELGPEPLSPAFDATALLRATRRRDAPIKSVLMDGRVVVGVGNIYANEALFRARIRPTIPACRLGGRRLGRLVESVRDTLDEAIAAGGSTLRDYVDSNGQPGDFQARLRVYGRQGEPCAVCGSTIRMLRIAGRATYFCPRCQR